MSRQVTITEIYQAYQLMSNLQQHQWRVTAVALTILESLQPSVQAGVNQEQVAAACLLHDMGNIIKFDLLKFPEFLEPKGLDYWQRVKENYIQRYGPNEHHASELIALELGVDQTVLRYIESLDFQQAQANRDTLDWGQKICDYADVRVGPYGVITLEQRFQDLRERYSHTFNQPADESHRSVFEAAHLEMEEQIQQNCSKPLSQLTDSTISGTIDALKSWPLKVPDSWDIPDWL